MSNTVGSGNTGFDAEIVTSEATNKRGSLPTTDTPPSKRQRCEDDSVASVASRLTSSSSSSSFMNPVPDNNGTLLRAIHVPRSGVLVLVARLQPLFNSYVVGPSVFPRSLLQLIGEYTYHPLSERLLAEAKKK